MEKEFNEKESLQLITGMIAAAKGNIKKGAGKHFLLWGYLICAASITHFVMINFIPSIEKYNGILWTSVTITGFLISLIMGFRDHGKREVTTYIGSISLHVWFGFMVCLLLYRVLPFNYYPLLMAMVMLAGDIVPGYYLNYKAKRENNV